MLNLTKLALKRPVSLILALVTLVFFGMQSVLGSKMELTPEMEMPMMIVSTVYAGASPEDINDLVSKPIEDAVASLSGIDTVSTYSMENVSIVLLQYNYGTNMDTAYLDLKKSMDGIKSDLPDDAKDSNIMEMDMNAQAVVTMTVSGGTDQNMYDYANNTLVPEFEKLSTVGEVSLSGGQAGYVRIELIPEKIQQFKLSMSTLAQLVGAADFSIPAGSTKFGKQSLSVSVGNSYDTIERIKNVIIPTASGDVIHLSDVANVYEALEDKSSIARYDGEDVLAIAIKKQQSSSAVEVSRQVKAAVASMEAANPDLHFTVISDSSDMINDSLTNVLQTLVMAVILSMIVLFLFFGDIKASMIVGTSIPIAVIVALIMMSAMGFSLNVITLGALVLGVGMMVDNSIVVLESCFRTKEGRSLYDAALEGAKLVLSSITGSTITTCVVFLPLALLQGLTGQLFKPLGFTIIFCMLASLISAATVVPLMYVFIHPREKSDAPVNRLVIAMQKGYRNLVRDILPKKGRVVIFSVVLLGISILMATKLGVELMPSNDEGIVACTIVTQPGLTIEENEKILNKVEAVVGADEDVENYMLTYGSSGLSISMSDASTLTAYLKDDRKLTTRQVMSKWSKEFQNMDSCTVTMELGSSTSSGGMSSGDQIEVDLQSTDYDLLKSTTDQVVAGLQAQPYVTKVHSSIENAAPLVKVHIDPVKAEAEGLTPAAVGGTIYSALSGVEATTITLNGDDVSVKVEYPENYYETIDQLQGMMITTARGTTLPLSDLGDIAFEDSPQTILRSNKQYKVQITAQPVESYAKTAEASMKQYVADYELPMGVEPAENSMDKMMGDELSGLAGAIGTAVFLIFIVMAMQFESPKFSLMVMFTIPFSLIGAFGLLFLANCKISMTSMLGFLMMIGTVVNNGILYVDTVNQFRIEMKFEDALVEAGAVRLRPILMTTLTTVLSMLPLGLAYGKSGATLQGLALVNIGGLIASTILSLLLLPTFYMIVDKLGKDRTMEGIVDVD